MDRAFSAHMVNGSFPGALPQAGMSRAFGAKQIQNRVLMRWKIGCKKLRCAGPQWMPVCRVDGYRSGAYFCSNENSC